MDSGRCVRITHPFHPLSGREIEVHERITLIGGPLVRYEADGGKLVCIPVCWTSLRVIDDFERVSAGRSLFRVDDLVALRALLDACLEGPPDSGQ